MIPAATTEFKHIVQLKNLPKINIELYDLLKENLSKGEDVVLQWEPFFKMVTKIFLSENLHNHIHLAVTSFSTSEMILAEPKRKEGLSNVLILGSILRSSPGKYIGMIQPDGSTSFELMNYDIEDDTEIEVDNNIRYIIRFNGNTQETYMVLGHSIKPASRLS